MNLDSFRLLAPLGSGSDAVAYRAQRVSDGSAVEVRVLSGARAHAGRWAWLTQRLPRAALLAHPGAVQVRALGLEHDPPFVALEWVEGNSLADEFHDRVPLAVSEAVPLAGGVAAVLTAAHRLGLTHGRLGPETVRRPPAGCLKVDFTGIDASPNPERASQPGADETPDPAADVYGVGALLFWLLTGERWATPAEGGDLSSLVGRTLPGLRQGRPDIGLPLERLVQEMLAADPGERPLAAEVEDRLLALLRDAGESSLNPDDVFRTVDAPSAMAVEPLPEQAGRLRFLDQLSPAVPTTGRQLGRFHLREKLGEGGMGAVYRAEDLTDGRVVAVKVLHPDWARRPEALRRFHKEARLLAEVNNPYVTNLLEANQDAGIPYLVLEFVAGQSLGRLLKERGRLDERLALVVIADVARALVDAHERGIVHRDIKPDNILLQPGECSERGAEPEAVDSTTFRVKLSDFGLARHVLESESLNLTQAGALLGTPLYMAPEQCSGGAVDPRTDVYALGATLFHLLAGALPSWETRRWRWRRNIVTNLRLRSNSSMPA